MDPFQMITLLLQLETQKSNQITSPLHREYQFLVVLIKLKVAIDAVTGLNLSPPNTITEEEMRKKSVTCQKS